jgi:uncharacterized protein
MGQIKAGSGIGSICKNLTLHRNDMAFELKYFGLAITKDDMIAIAESMK